MAAAAAAAESFELEAKRKDDGSWHPCQISLITSSNNPKLGISLHLGMEDTISTREDMIERLRFCSNHLQDGDCYLLKEGDQVHAMNSKQVGSSYFDAVIVEAYRVRHSGRLQCRCTFKVRWLAPSMEGISVIVPSKSIMKLSDKQIDTHPLITAFLAALEPLNEEIIPPSHSSLEKPSPTNLHGELEKQVEEISKLADASQRSKDVKQANSGGKSREDDTSTDAVLPQNQYDSRGVCWSPAKGQAHMQHFDNIPLLSPLAARAALASLMCGQLLEKQKSCISWLQGHLPELSPKDEKKHNLEVEAGVLQSDAHAFSDTIKLPNLVQESTNVRGLEDCVLQSSVTSCRSEVMKPHADDSSHSVTSRRKPTRASKEAKDGNLVSSVTFNPSAKKKLNYGASTRLTRSVAKKQILELTAKGTPNEFSPLCTSLSQSGQHSENIRIGQASGDGNEIKERETNGSYKMLISIETISDTEREKKIAKFSSDVTEDRGESEHYVVSKVEQSSRAKRKNRCSQKPKPILRFSARLRSLSRTPQS